MGGSYDSITMVTAVDRHPQCTGVHSHHKGYGNNRGKTQWYIKLNVSFTIQLKRANGN